MSLSSLNDKEQTTMSLTNILTMIMVLCVGLSIVGCATAQESAATDKPPLRLACRLANYGPYQDIALAHIHEMGLKYVFINIPKPEEVDGILEQMKANELQVLVVRGDTNLSLESAVDELAVQFATCEKLGVHYMFLSPKRHDAPKEIVLERLRSAGDVAAKHDVTLVLETHPDLGTNGDVHVETMKAINHPNVRVNFDTGNITFYNADTDAAAELKKCIEYVATVEVKDHSAELEAWVFPALGEGKTNFPGVFKVLREHNYNGPVTIEVEGIKGIEWSVEDRKKAMEDSVAYLRSIESFE